MLVVCQVSAKPFPLNNLSAHFQSNEERIKMKGENGLSPLQQGRLSFRPTPAHKLQQNFVLFLGGFREKPVKKGVRWGAV